MQVGHFLVIGVIGRVNLVFQHLLTDGRFCFPLRAVSEYSVSSVKVYGLAINWVLNLKVLDLAAREKNYEF